MQMRLLIQPLLFHPLAIACVSAAVGAGAVICFTEIPRLQSADAAAWASAVATTGAVVAALYVGLAPEKARRKASVQRAWAMTQWAEGALGMQLVHLGQAIAYMRAPVLHAPGRAAVVQQLQVLDAGPVRALVDHFDALDPLIIRSAGRCVIDMERGIQTMRNLAQVPSDAALDMDGMRDIFFDVYMSMDDAREAFAKLVYGSAEKSNEPVEVKIARARRTGG